MNEFEEPLGEATATLPPDELQFSVIEDIDPSDLPGGAITPRSFEQSSEQVRLTDGNHRGAVRAHQRPLAAAVDQ